MKWAVGGKQNSPLSISSSNQIEFGCEPPAKYSALNEFSASPRGEFQKMFVALNSVIDDRLSSMCVDAHSLEPVDGDVSVVPVT